MKKTKYSLISALLFVFALSGAVLSQQLSLKLPPPNEYTAPTGSPVAKYGHLSISGNKMKGSAFTGDVQLRGMSFFWGNAAEGRPFYNDGVVGWLVHDWKVDVLRAAVAIADEPKGGGNAGYLDGDQSGQWNQLKTVVEGAIRRGIYVIVDWHTHSATDSKYSAGAKTFFERVAKEWGKYPNIIYEIFNEPCSQSGCSGDDWGTLKTYSDNIIKAIRDAGSDNVIIVGTPAFSSLGSASSINSNPVADSKGNSAYSLHFYAAESWHDNYKNNATTLLNGNKAVFVSEFGVTNANGNGSINTGNSDTWLKFCDDNKISWVNWSIANKDEASGALKNTVSNAEGGWSTSDLSSSGTYIRNKLTTSGGGITSTTYTINTSAAPSDGGSVTKSPAGPNYNYGQSVTLTAAPASNYEFSKWSGDLTGSASGSYTATIRGINLNIGAVFFKSGLINNGTFASDPIITNTSTPWTHYRLNTPQNQGAASAPQTSDNMLSTSVTRGSNNVEHVYVFQDNIALGGGKGYRLSFSAKADKGRKVAVAVANSSARTTRYAIREIGLSTEHKDYNIDFVVPAGSGVTARVEFWYGVVATNWSMTNVSLLEGNYQNGGSGVDFDLNNTTGVGWDTDIVSIMPTSPAVKTAWSVARTGGGLQLSGPAVSGGAKVSLYDVRGRMVKRVSLSNGSPLMLNSSAAPAGSYLLVVRNGSGKEVYKTRVLLAK